MELPATAEPRKETSAWTDAYSRPEQVRRRRATISRKLTLLGVDQADRRNTILDLCCGSGETLDALHALGFRSLRGLDIAIPENLEADTRFETQTGDAAVIPLPSASADWVLIVHALHHLGPAGHIEQVLQECHRVLKPGGKLGIIDFPSSLQIRLAFWFFRENIGLWTPYLKNFGRLIQEEWSFLREYLKDWPDIDQLLRQGPFEVESHRRGLFYFYRTFRKPMENRR